MHDEELLAVLKSEWINAEAKARGAEAAYQWKACEIIRRNFPFHTGHRIVIKCQNADGSEWELKAISDGIEWDEYSRWGACPVIQGFRLSAKTGLPSKYREALCPAAHWPYITRAPYVPKAKVKTTDSQP